MRILTRKGIAIAALGLLLLAAALFSGSGWYFSDQIGDGALKVSHEPDKYDLQVTAIADGRATLRPASGAPTGNLVRGGIWGLAWDGGYAQVSDILNSSPEDVTRRLSPILGTPQAGQQARLDSFSFPGDPRSVGLQFQEIAFPAPLGPLAAWYLPGSKSTWAIFVHGWMSSRREALRLLPTVTKHGYPCLVITYRNDEGAPPSPDHRYHWGDTEWQDVDAAARYAVSQGAKDLVLVGYSMGGGTAVNVLYHSPSLPVRAVILDAPVLSFGATIDYQGQRRGLPGPLIANGKLWAGWRFGVDWTGRDYTSREAELRTPILLFHGDADERTPIGVSDAFAPRRPDLVRYVRVAGASHVRSWNVDPAAYASEVERFLAQTVP